MRREGHEDRDKKLRSDFEKEDGRNEEADSS
jgi:hypothetical protein